MARTDERALARIDVQVHLGTDDEVGAAREALAPLSGRSGEDDEAPLSYRGTRSIHVTLTDGERSDDVRIPSVASPPKPGPMPGRPGSEPKRDLDLSNLYTPSGLLGDGDTNLIPDRIDAVLSPAGEGTTRTVDLAARLGLESTGISVPLVRLPDEIEEAGDEPTLVLAGTDHPLVDKDRLPDLAPGQGWIEVVPGAFGPKAALIITGGDSVGVDRALEQVSERFPHLWDRGNQKNRPTLDDVEMDLWKFFSGRSSAGQAATALYKLDKLVSSLSEKDLGSARVVVSLEEPADGLEQVVRERAQALGAGSLEVVIDNRDVQNAQTLLEESFEVPSEVEAFRRLFRERVLPRVRRGRPVFLEARLSEPPELLSRLAEEAKAALADKGAHPDRTEVRFLSAYKQGYSWLYDVVRPQLEQAGAELGEITIRFKETVPPEEWPQQAIYTKVRWLHEIFPIDEILARELDVDAGTIRFEMAPPDAPTYEIIVTSAAGEEILRDTFEPKIVLRPYLDRFRDYEMVRVTTGSRRAIALRSHDGKDPAGVGQLFAPSVSTDHAKENERREIDVLVKGIHRRDDLLVEIEQVVRLAELEIHGELAEVRSVTAVAARIALVSLHHVVVQVWQRVGLEVIPEAFGVRDDALVDDSLVTHPCGQPTRKRSSYPWWKRS